MASDSKIHDTVEQINSLKTSREFYLSFAENPQEFITNWLISQTRDLKVGFSNPHKKENPQMNRI